MPEAPKYIHMPSRAFGRPPYIGSNALLQGGWIESNRGAVQSYLDRTLNMVAPGHYRAIAVASGILMTSLHVPQMRSGHPIDRNWGYVPETDIALWALIYAGEIARPSEWSLYWTPVYMFVDDAAAVSGGREIFGFPKLFARISRTGTADADYGLSVSVKAFTELGSDQPVQDVEILSIAAGKLAHEDTEAKDVLSGWLSSVDHVADRISRTLLKSLRPPQVDFPILQLKQFPGIENADQAVFQALVEVKMKSLKILGAGIASGNPVLTLTAPRSLAIDQELQTPNIQTMKNCFWVRQDFATQPGRIVSPER